MGQSRSDLGSYLKDIRDLPSVSVDAERELFRRVLEENDPDAREQLIQANLRLVVTIARQFLGRGMPLSDLVEEGNIGLLKAIEGFDPLAECRFSTYAAWWIRQSIKRALINTVQPVHVPAYMIEMMNRLRQVTRELEHDLGRAPTTDEIAGKMEISPKQLHMIRNAVRAYHSPTQYVGKEEQSTLGEVIVDQRSGTPDQQVLHQDDLTRMLHTLDEIDERAAQIIKLRFGLEGDQPMTLKEIGQRIGLTRERVRQIEQETLGKLKSSLIDTEAKEE